MIVTNMAQSFHELAGQLSERAFAGCVPMTVHSEANEVIGCAGRICTCV